MAHRRALKGPSSASSIEVPLEQPDRSAPGPSHQTLLEIAEKRGLLVDDDDDDGDNAVPGEMDPPIGRFGEAVVWSISLAMLHFTLDVLVQHQYAMEISWRDIAARSLQALGVILLLFYTLHPHPTPSVLTPRLPRSYQYLLHELVFFVGSTSAGCYLIYITNEHGYHAVMKRAPALGCLWIWSVIELDLKWALVSLVSCVAFLWWGGYKFL